MPVAMGGTKEPIDEAKRIELRESIKHTIEARKSHIISHFAQLKLKTPACIKSMKLAEIRSAGATVDNLAIYLPTRTLEEIQFKTDKIRKKDEMHEKIYEIRERQIRAINKYYEDLKKSLPQDIRASKIKDCKVITV